MSPVKLKGTSSYDLGIIYSNIIRTDLCIQSAKDDGKCTRHGAERTQSFFIFGDMTAMEIRAAAERRPKLTTGSIDNELSGAVVHNSPPLTQCSAGAQAVSSASPYE